MALIGYSADSLLSVRESGVMRACRRETPPPGPRPHGAGEWSESVQKMRTLPS